MFKLLLKVLASVVPVALITMIVILNCNLYRFHSENKVDQHRIVKQLRFIGNAIDDGADVEMQALYPEGFVFINSLYGLSWCDLVTADNTFRKEGLIEMEKSLERLQSDEAKSIFYEETSIPLGAFYNGWSTYVLGRKIERQDHEVAVFKNSCEKIAQGFSLEIYPESYPSQAWPGDVMVCMAVLALHDRLFPPQYQNVIRRWITSVRQNLDRNGLIPHSALHSGDPVQTARGESQCLMLIFLREIDPDFAEEQFTRFKEKFIDSRFGLIGVREYPIGESGLGDVDSGPVILGMGGAASIVGIRTLATFEDVETMKLRNGIEACALPWEDERERSYLFGTLPMADAFITWSQCGLLSDNNDYEQLSGTALAVYSVITLLGLIALLVWFWR